MEMDDRCVETLIQEWIERLPRHEITQNMMRWMQAYTVPCDKHCCFSSMCAAIHCSSCLVSLNSYNSAAERFICIECDWQGLQLNGLNDDSHPEGCPELCNSCFFSPKVLHWHRDFCRIDTKGVHSYAKRETGYASMEVLTMNDLVPWPCAKQKAYMEQYSKECSVCLEEFDPEGDTIHRQIVSPPGCPHYHEASITHKQEGVKELLGTACCGRCMLYSYETSGRLAHCKRRNGESSGTAELHGDCNQLPSLPQAPALPAVITDQRHADVQGQEQEKGEGHSHGSLPTYFPPFCKLCEHHKEMEGWYQDFCSGFQHINKEYFLFQQRPSSNAAVEGQAEEIAVPVDVAFQILCAAAALPSCATPGYQDVLQLAQRHTPSALPQPVSECRETDQGEDDYKKEGEEKLQMSPDSDPVQENEKVPTSHSAAQEEISSNSALVSGVAAGNVGGQAPCGKVSGNNTSGVISQVDANGPNSMGKKQTSRSTNVSPTPNGPGDNCRRSPLPLLPLSSARKLFLDALCQLHTQPYIQAQALRAAENSVPAGKIHCSSR